MNLTHKYGLRPQQVSILVVFILFSRSHFVLTYPKCLLFKIQLSLLLVVALE
jgi:hypothetical protein